MTQGPERPEIKITDRRHFDQAGSRRPESDVGADPAAPEAPPAPVPPEPPPQPPDPEISGFADAGPRGPETGSDKLFEGLSSSFSLLVARLAQETEIYLGLVPYPGKETAEPDLEAAKAMIDMLSMLQEKTKGNLADEESRLVESLLYAYRLEFVRRRSGGEGR